MHKINWCNGGLQLKAISANNIGENDLNTRMKYIMVRLDNWDRTLVEYGWQYIWYSMGKEFCMHRLDWI